MAKTDFTFVGQPHDPLSISGSDPFTGSSDARLAVWYNFDKGWVNTFDELASMHSDTKAGDRQRVTRMWDKSEILKLDSIKAGTSPPTKVTLMHSKEHQLFRNLYMISELS